jgi:6-pyruvoyltetrahydropterin/6-carboxytetrahydropterin synthase
MNYIVTIEDSFSAAHFYNQEKWTKEKNQKIFGKCYSKFGHGHDYKVSLTFSTDNIELKEEKLALHSLCELLDHKHLNFEIANFKNAIPTTENIGLYLLEKLKTYSFSEKLQQLELFERPDLFVKIVPLGCS